MEFVLPPVCGMTGVMFGYFALICFRIASISLRLYVFAVSILNSSAMSFLMQTPHEDPNSRICATP